LNSDQIEIIKINITVKTFFNYYWIIGIWGVENKCIYFIGNEYKLQNSTK